MGCQRKDGRTFIYKAMNLLSMWHLNRYLEETVLKLASCREAYAKTLVHEHVGHVGQTIRKGPVREEVRGSAVQSSLPAHLEEAWETESQTEFFKTVPFILSERSSCTAGIIWMRLRFFNYVIYMFRMCCKQPIYFSAFFSFIFLIHVGHWQGNA